MRMAALGSRVLFLLLAVLGGCSGAAVQADIARPAVSLPRILVFTRTAGSRHDSIPVAVETLRALGGETGLQVEHTEDPARFDSARLARYRAVVFANTTLDVLDASQQQAFERFVRAGGGFVGLHSAADTEHDWPWYGELVGTWFESHPPGLQDSPVRFEAGHALPGAGEWQVRDELYNYRRNPRPWVNVIATVDEAAYAGGNMGKDHPIAWCHSRLCGRAWYTGLGHAPALYADARFRAHVLRGLRYATGQSDAC